MATLEKIRSKSVLLLVIIMAALLAFILGDFFTSGRTFFGTGTTVAKVAGHKIDIQQFQRKVEEASQAYQQSGHQIDGAALQQEVLSGLVSEALFNDEISKLGIVVTDNELTEAMLGVNAGPLNLMVRQQIGVESAADLHDMAFSPSKYGLDAQQAAQLRQYWMSLEEQIEQQLLQQKFQTLFVGALVANKLDAKAIYDENAATARVAYTKVLYTKVSDENIEVSEKDIANKWAERKNLYTVDEPTRYIDYITVNIAPSAADLQAASRKVEEALNGLRSEQGTQGLEGMIEFIPQRATYTYANLPNKAVKNFADTAKVGSAAVVSNTGNDYQLAKLMGASQQVDSVNFDFISFQGPRAQIDSLIAVLNAGGNFTDASATPGVTQATADMWVPLSDANYASIKDFILDAPIGRYFSPDTLDQAGRIFRVNTRKAPVTIYDMALISYTAEPSNATINELQGNLSRFVKENATAAAFAENAANAGYTLRTAMVTASSPQVANLSDSRAAVAWAMDAKKGQVSPVFGDETSGRYMAVALEDIYGKGYITHNNPDVNKDLAIRVAKDKKAAQIIEQYAGKGTDVVSYAAAMEEKVDTTNVNFGQTFIRGIGVNESAVLAAATVAEPGALVGPMQGNTGVVVMSVVDVDNQGRPFNLEESSRQFVQQRGATVLIRKLPEILRGHNKVTNNTLKFYRQ